MRQGKSSLGSTCTSPHRKCVVAEQEVDPHTPRNSSCTQRRWSSDIPTSSLWQKTASGHSIAHRCRKPKAVVAERHNACATITDCHTLDLGVWVQVKSQRYRPYLCKISRYLPEKKSITSFASPQQGKLAPMLNRARPPLTQHLPLIRESVRHPQRFF